MVNKEKFDDEVVKKAVRMKRRMLLVECEDPNGNSPLSESASQLFHVLFISFLCHIDVQICI